MFLDDSSITVQRLPDGSLKHNLPEPVINHHSVELDFGRNNEATDNLALNMLNAALERRGGEKTVQLGDDIFVHQLAWDHHERFAQECLVPIAPETGGWQFSYQAILNWIDRASTP